jgi:hypothetical protein
LPRGFDCLWSTCFLCCSYSDCACNIVGLDIRIAVDAALDVEQQSSVKHIVVEIAGSEYQGVYSWRSRDTEKQRRRGTVESKAILWDANTNGLIYKLRRSSDLLSRTIDGILVSVQMWRRKGGPKAPERVRDSS